MIVSRPQPGNDFGAYRFGNFINQLRPCGGISVQCDDHVGVKCPSRHNEVRRGNARQGNPFLRISPRLLGLAFLLCAALFLEEVTLRFDDQQPILSGPVGLAQEPWVQLPL